MSVLSFHGRGSLWFWVAGVLLFSVGSVGAQGTGYALVLIRNNNTAKVLYQYKWSGGVIWYDASIEGDARRTHSLRLDQNGNAPPLLIRYNRGDGRIIDYTVDYNRVASTADLDGARIYYFGESAPGLWGLFGE